MVRALEMGEEVETRVFKARMFPVEEVAEMVNIALGSAVVVPTETRSVSVVVRMRVPVSVHPPAEEARDQERMPEPSVCRNPFAVWEEGQVYVCPLKVVSPDIARVEEPVIGPEELREPEVKREEPTVEEAEERKPPVRVDSPVMERVDWPVNAPPNVPVEEAVKRLETARSPEW